VVLKNGDLQVAGERARRPRYWRMPRV
jgi:hypothetical protein